MWHDYHRKVVHQRSYKYVHVYHVFLPMHPMPFYNVDMLLDNSASALQGLLQAAESVILLKKQLFFKNKMEAISAASPPSSHPVPPLSNGLIKGASFCWPCGQFSSTNKQKGSPYFLDPANNKTHMVRYVPVHVRILDVAGV